MIDFDALVLKPAGDIFQIMVVYTPTVSQPGVPPFAIFGVYSSAPVDVIMQDETIYSDQQTSLGVRLRDFAAYPMEGDHVTITDSRHPAYGKQFWIGDLDEDGQGGGLLLLRNKEPPDVINPYPGETEVTTYAQQIQAKAMQLCQAGYGPLFKTYRLTPMLQVQPEHLPVLGVYILREQRLREFANEGEPKFETVLTLGFSGGIRVETDKQNDQPVLEDLMSMLDDILLSDPKFIVLTEGIPSIDRTSQFAKVGETTLYEIRLEMQLRYTSWYPPRVDDWLEKVHVTTQFPDKAHVDAGTEQIIREYDIETTRRVKAPALTPDPEKET